MKTTLDLPDELMRSVKMRAVEEDRRLKDVVAELLELGLLQASRASRVASSRVELPLVACGHPAAPDEEMTPERIARTLEAEEARSVSGHRSGEAGR